MSNALPRHLHDSVHTIFVFGRLHRRHFSFFQITNVRSALGAFLALMRYIKSCFAYLFINLLLHRHVSRLNHRANASQTKEHKLRSV